MTLAELVAQARLFLDDPEMPGTGATPDSDSLWSNDELTLYLNKAIDEGCLRGRLLRDSTTAAICQITVTAGTGTYALDPRILNIERAKLASMDYAMTPITAKRLDKWVPSWEALAAIAEPPYWLCDLDTLSIRIVPAPAQNDTLNLTVWRAQETPLAWATPTGTPDIPAIHHMDLLDWVLHLAYQKKDSETADPNLSAKHGQLFAAKFGDRPTAKDMERWREGGPRRTPARFF